MYKVKFNKIELEDIEYDDIMGKNYDIFNCQDSNRLFDIKSKESKLELN